MPENALTSVVSHNSTFSRPLRSSRFVLDIDNVATPPSTPMAACELPSADLVAVPKGKAKKERQSFHETLHGGIRSASEISVHLKSVFLARRENVSTL